jgi:oligoendopeptidase F
MSAKTDTARGPAGRGGHSDSLPDGLDATQWSQLEPLYRELQQRQVGSPADLERLILDRSDLDAAASEAEANLYIAMTCRTDDEAARKAFLAFVENVEPKLRTVGFELDTRISGSPHAKSLDQKRYGVYLRAMRQEVRLFRAENVPLQTEATKLDQEYSQVAGAMTVEFEGRTQTLPQMSRYLESTDRGVRKSAWEAIAARRLQDRARIDGIYDGLVRIRHTMGQNAGFANFRDFQHERLHRFDYSVADCRQFHASIEEVCVPLMKDLHAERAKMLGIPACTPWDLKVDLHGRAPLRPFEGAEQLVHRTSKVFHRLDGHLGEMFDSMRGGGCLDLESRAGKAPGGYQYQRQRSRKPFIFMNAAGLQRDLITMVHEAGHAFHSLLCADDPLVAYRGSPIEFAEVASMSMELLTFPQLDEFYAPQDAARAKRDKLEDIVSILPWVATIDAFQHWVYEHPDHTHEQRTAAWVALHKRFGGDVDYHGHHDALEAAWQRQLHLFGSPFYYIEYGIAQLGALQLWMVSRHDPAAALAGYKRALSLGGSHPLPELFEAAGLEFDFGPAMMRKLVTEVQDELSRLPA